MSYKEIEVAVKVTRATAKAILVDHGGKEECWLPISQISDYSGSDDIERKPSTVTSVFIPDWLAKEKGIL